MGDMEGEAATDPSACYPSSSSSGDGGLSWALQGLTLAEGGGYGGNDHGYHSHYYHQQPPGPFESRGAYGGACSTAEDHGKWGTPVGLSFACVGRSPVATMPCV